ncbi:MAG: fumarylacetoacetate hydrolase family protein [Pseudomonadota bacterium]
MKLVTYRSINGDRCGLLHRHSVVDSLQVARMAGWSDVECADIRTNRNLLQLPTARLHALQQTVQQNFEDLKKEGAVFSISETGLAAPIPDPQKIICIGLNFHDHAEEVGVKPPDAPIFFAKFPNSLIGASDPIIPPRDTQQVDYEAELAVVIGRRGRYIETEDALSHVAGAMVINDVSARDLQLANQLWTGGKAIDSFAPCGPSLVTIDEIEDLQNLWIQTRVNGELLQDGNTASMIFPVPVLISFLSRIMTLEPGDIIATGTPAGVGLSRNPQRFLNSGDRVEVEIESLGMTNNPVVPAA